MAMTDLTIVTRSLSSRRLSTAVTALMVAVAVMLMLVLFALHDGARNHFKRGTGNIELLVTAEPSPFISVLNSFFYTSAPAAAMDLASVERFRQGDLSRFFRVAIPIQLGDSYRGYPVVATNTEYFRFFEPRLGKPWEFAQGKVFTDTFDIVVGARAARELNLTIGERIALTHGLGDEPGAHVHDEFQFTVVGIVEPTGSAHDRALFIPLEGSWVLHAHDRRLAEAGTDVAATTTTTTNDVTDRDRLATGLLLISRTPAALPQGGAAARRTSGFTVASPGREITQLEEMMKGINAIFIGMVSVVLVSSGLGIMLALYNSMDLRRRQIAVLRVLGCSAGRIFHLILTEAAIIGLIGGVAGTVFGLFGVRFAVSMLRDRLGVVFDPSIEPVHALGLVLGATAIAALAGILPAIKAYATPVASSLRPLG